MEAYCSIRDSQIYLYKEIPLYYKTSANEYALYKREGETLPLLRVDGKKYPQLYVRETDQNTARKEALTCLNKRLAEQILSKDLKAVRAVLFIVVKEALETVEKMENCPIPETIEILFEGFSERSELLESLVKINASSNCLTEHTINVLLLTLRYAIFHELPDDSVKRLAFCAFTHDIGMTEVDNKILEANHRLTDDEFEKYTRHTSMGCDLLLRQKSFDPLAATVAQEHHERIDGSGYPYGRKNICEESQLIGLIDCYEPLTYRDKKHRKAKKPYDTLQLIKEELLQGRFNRLLFKNFCASLTHRPFDSI